MTERRDEEAIGIFRIDEDRADLPRVPQTEVLPRAPRVGGLVDAIAHRQVRPLQTLAAAHIDDVGVGRRDRNGADRLSGLLVEDRCPRLPEVGRLPDPSVVDAYIEDVGLLGDAGRTDGSPAAEWADVAPAKVRVEGRVGLGVQTGQGGPHQRGYRQRAQGLERMCSFHVVIMKDPGPRADKAL